jgi:hypothetical protein
MLSFAEQTGSGAVIVVWSFLNRLSGHGYLKVGFLAKHLKRETQRLENRKMKG